MASARTDVMDTRKILKPVVVERPARNREMISQTKDFSEVDSKEGRSIKNARSEVLHEGYVGGQKYLVPDSNLEAMADMINLKMRRREYSKYVNDKERSEQEIDPDEDYQRRGQKMLKKIDNLATDSYEDSVLSDEDDEWSGDKNDNEVDERETDEEGKGDGGEEENEKQLDEGDIEEEKEEIYGEERENVEVEEEERDGLEGADKEEGIEEVECKGLEEEGVEDQLALEILKKPVEPVWPIRERRPMEEEYELDKLDGSTPTSNEYQYTRRFIISGHLRSNRKPIYIVQEYEGPSLFQNKNPKFFSRRSDKDVDVLMCGEFFKESILEEDRYMQPASLKTGPRKVVIDWKSLVFEEKFTHVFVGTDVDVQISGSFVEHTQKDLFAPLITFVLRKGTARKSPVYHAEEPSGPPSENASVYVMRAIEENPFEKEDMWLTGRQRKRSVALEELNGRGRAVLKYPSRPTNFKPETHAKTRSSVSKDKVRSTPCPGQESGSARSSEAPSESSRNLYKLRDGMRETLLLPETSVRRAHGGSAHLLESASLRRRYIQSSLASEESPAEILEAFVRKEGEKRRERRRKERQRTLGSVLSRFFSLK